MRLDGIRCAFLRYLPTLASHAVILFFAVEWRVRCGGSPKSFFKAEER